MNSPINLKMEFEKRNGAREETSHKICTGLLVISLIAIGSLSIHTLISLNNYKDSVNLAMQSRASSSAEDGVLPEEEVNIILENGEVESSVSRKKRTTSGSGSIYIHWGRVDCPTRSNVVYFGEVAGSAWGASGSTNYLCIPNGDLQWLGYNVSAPIHSRIHGVDFQTSVYEATSRGLFPTRVDNGNVLCSLCQTPTTSDNIMIPGRTSCPDRTWRREYFGYLMTTADSLENQMDAICIDYSAQVHSANDGNTLLGSHLVHVKAYCYPGSGDITTCTDAEHNREMACVVCSK